MAGIVTYQLPGAVFEATLTNAPTGLVAANSIGFRILDDQGAVVLARTAVGCVETPAGSGHYAIRLTAPTTLGAYTILADTDPGGAATPTNSAADTLIVTTSIAQQVITASGGPTVGPCQLWVSGGDVATYCAVAPSPTTDALALVVSQLLYEISGRQFSGLCSSTVRPCAMTCGCWGGLVGSLAISGAVALGVPINWTGGWWDCGGNSCGCGVLSEVLLEPYPIQAITQVKISGVVQAPSTYRLDGYRRLVCTNGLLWPACQDLTRDDTQSGTWSVAYTHGMAPPQLGVMAALQLACQLNLSMSGGACALPDAVTRVTRQGITIDKGQLAALMAATGGTGLALVDSFLATYNPHGLRRRPAVWSPDAPTYPRRIN